MKINPKKKPSKEPRKITLNMSEDEYNRLHSSLESRKNSIFCKKPEKMFINKTQMKLKKAYKKYKSSIEEKNNGN